MASGAPSANGPIGGRVSAQELKRLEGACDTIVGQRRCDLDRTSYLNWYKSVERLPEDARKRVRRCNRAMAAAKMQNDFAAVGAGPNRFALQWD